MADRNVQKALAGQRRVTSNPYYSKVRFGTALTGGGGVASTYTIASGTELRAFGYAIGQDMAPAGRSGTTGTIADTNLQAAGRTIGGQRFHIKGMSIEVLPNSLSGELIAALFPETSVRLSLNGSEQQILLGLMHMWPAGGGLSGAQQSNTGAQALGGGRPVYWFPNNGLPGVQNYGRMPEQLIWKEEGKVDSNLAVLLRNERAVAFTTQLADEAAAAGVRGYANPAAAAVFVELFVSLCGAVESKRSSLM